MYLCLCHGVSQKKIELLVSEGAQSIRQIQKACQAGTDCGSCLKDLKRYVSRQQSSSCEKSCLNCPQKRAGS